MNYPALNAIRQHGEMPPQFLRQDALGRYAFRVDQAKENAGDLRPSPTGGTPAYRGPESFTPYLLEAARTLQIDPGRATSPQVMGRVGQLGTTPQAMARTFRISDPRKQAIQLLKGIR